MLLKVPYKNGDVITLKLSSGEEIVARFRGDETESFTIEQPMSLINTPHGIGLVPYMFTVDPGEHLVISKRGVIVHSATRKETANDYLRQTTGLQMVS
jgi:hypothetical protein